MNGTVNDLAVGGARPLALSLAFILEEGLPAGRPARGSWRRRGRRRSAPASGSSPATRRSSGAAAATDLHQHLGHRHRAAGRRSVVARVRPGDAVLLSGPIGDHGVAILSQREGLDVRRATLAQRHRAAPRARGRRARGLPATSTPCATRRAAAWPPRWSRSRHASASASRSTSAPSRCATSCAARASCSASIRSSSRTRASWSPSFPTAEPSAVLAAMRAHPLGRRRRADRARRRDEHPGHRAAADADRWRSHPRSALRRGVAAHLLR